MPLPLDTLRLAATPSQARARCASLRLCGSFSSEHPQLHDSDWYIASARHSMSHVAVSLWLAQQAEAAACAALAQPIPAPNASVAPCFSEPFSLSERRQCLLRVWRWSGCLSVALPLPSVPCAGLQGVAQAAQTTRPAVPPVGLRTRVSRGRCANRVHRAIGSNRKANSHAARQSTSARAHKSTHDALLGPQPIRAQQQPHLAPILDQVPGSSGERAAPDSAWPHQRRARPLRSCCS